MKLRPLGWELVAFLLSFDLLAVGMVVGVQALIIGSVWIMMAALPIVLLSFLFRFVAAATAS